ncbi:unnamed protein product [Cercospora beticola]|nr:unnamed protein product [Cercospora beticola]
MWVLYSTRGKSMEKHCELLWECLVREDDVVLIRALQDFQRMALDDSNASSSCTTSVASILPLQDLKALGSDCRLLQFGNFVYVPNVHHRLWIRTSLRTSILHSEPSLYMRDEKIMKNFYTHIFPVLQCSSQGEIWTTRSFSPFGYFD